MAEWGKVYATLHSSRKWRAATKPARSLWTTAFSWCIDQDESEGLVPTHMLRALDGTPSEAACLVSVGLWERVDGGWLFHDWLDYQRSRERILADQAAARERQRRARDKARESAERHAVTDGVSHTTREEESREETYSPSVVTHGESSSSSSPRRRERGRR